MIPDEVMDYFRKRAVQAIWEDGYDPEIVAEVFGFSRSCIYEWLTRYGLDHRSGHPRYAASVTV